MCKITVCLLLSAALAFCAAAVMCGCADNGAYGGELLRLHIRANSNDECDQAVKLDVRDAVNRYIADNVDKTTFADAYREVGERLTDIEDVATGALRDRGYSYTAKAKLVNEYFPARMYGDTVVPDGYYDALIIELGAGEGNNWWCVIYPPLCYGEEFEYKSFFAELFS